MAGGNDGCCSPALDPTVSSGSRPGRDGWSAASTGSAGSGRRRWSSISSTARGGSDRGPSLPSNRIVAAIPATSCDGVGRRSGSRSRQRSSGSTSSAGSPVRSGGWVASRTSTSMVVSPWYGACPVAAYSSSEPSENTSLAGPVLRASLACSGAM